jgi:hypothetical protein
MAPKRKLKAITSDGEGTSNDLNEEMKHVEAPTSSKKSRIATEKSKVLIIEHCKSW